MEISKKNISMKALSTLDAVRKFNWPYIRPKSCELTLHYLCNARCVFCYTETSVPKERLSLKDAVSYLKRSYANGSRLCQLIGGEPTTYPELEKVILAAKKIGFPIIQMVTNGIVLSDYTFLKNLKESGLNSVTFSIHSHIPKKHDTIVGIEGAFNKIIKAIENAIKLGLHITVGTAVNSLNYMDVDSLVKFLYSKYRIETFHIIGLHIIGEAERFKNNLKVSYKRTVPYVRRAIEFLSSKNAFPLAQPLSNYTPCLLPGYENLITDWKIPFSDDDLILPEKTYFDSMYTMITNTLRMKSKRCNECIYSKICAGFEKKYYEEFGDDEFVPLKKIYPSPGLSCFYRD